MGFKLFDELIQSPEITFILAFLFLVLIIVLVKIDKLEKVVKEAKDKYDELVNKLNKLEKEQEDTDSEVDIIDKFLKENGCEVIKTKKKKYNSDSVLEAPKISHILDPKEEDEGEQE